MRYFKNLSTLQKAVSALIIANIIWGAASPIFKWTLEGGVEPFTLAFLRFFIAGCILLPFAINKLSIRKKDFLSVFFLALFGITINISFFFLGLQLTSSINAPIIASSGPIILILGAILFLHEKPKNKVIIGTIISLLGVIVVVIRPILEKGFDGSVTGNLFFVIATVAAVVHTLILKKLTKDYDPITLTFWSFIVGSALFLPFVGWEAQRVGILADLSIQGLVGIVFGALLSSALAYHLYNYSLKYMQANSVGVFVYIDPVIAILIAIPLLGEVVTPAFVIGSILVFLGIFIAEGRVHYHPFHKLFSKQ